MDVTPLMATCLMGLRESAALLLERGADPNTQTSNTQMEVSAYSCLAYSYHADGHNYDRTARLLLCSLVGMARRRWSSCC